MAFRGTLGANNTTAAATVSLSLTTGWTGSPPQPGDIILLACAVDKSSSTFTVSGSTFSAIPGLSSAQLAAGQGTSTCNVLYRVCDGTEGSITIGVGSSNLYTVTARAYSGRAASPFTVTPTTHNVAAAASPLSISVTALTANAGDDLALMIAVGAQGAGGVTTFSTLPTGFGNSRVDSNTVQFACAQCSCDETNVSAGSNTPTGGQITFTGSSNEGYCAYFISLAQAPAGGTGPTRGFRGGLGLGTPFSRLRGVYGDTTPSGVLPAVLNAIIAGPQAYDFTLPAVIIRSSPGFQGPTVSGYVAAPLPIDLTQQSTVIRSSPGFQGPTVKGYVASEPQFVDLTQQATIIRSSPGYQGPTVSGYTAGPLPYDLTLPAIIINAAFNPQGPSQCIGRYIVGQQIYVDVAPLITSSAAASAIQPSTLGTSYFVGTQAFDYTLQAVIKGSSPGYQGPTVRPLAPIPPQAVDYTQQTIINGSAASALILGPTVIGYTAGPAPFDYTIQAVISTQSTFSPNVPVVGPPLQINLSLSFIRMGGNTY